MFLTYCGRPDNGPSTMSMSYSPESVRVHGKGANIADGIQVATQLMPIWGDYLGGPKVITSVFANE